MLTIPESLAPVTSLLEQYEQPLLSWLSDQVYERLLARDAHDPLVAIKARLDFGPLEAACADYHHRSGAGRPVTHSVARLLRVLFLLHNAPQSLRAAERQVRWDLRAKWFAGYEVWEEGPDHSTIHDFELYVMSQHHRLYFDAVLAQIDASLPDQRGQDQVGDTFALQADAALESLTGRLRHVSRRLLAALRSAAPATLAMVESQVDLAALVGSKLEKRAYNLTEAERQARLERTVAAILATADWVCQQGVNETAVLTWLFCLVKILADEVELEVDEAGRLLSVRRLAEKERGVYRVCSATDPEATIRNHGPGKEDFGYNVSLAVNEDFVREIHTATGSQPDPVAIPALLTAQIEQHDLCPDKLIYDQIAGTGKTAAAVAEATGGRTQLVARPMPYEKRSPNFGPSDFTLSEDEFSLTCPHGRRTWRKYRSDSGDGFTFRFLPAQCEGCPFLQQCRGSTKPPTTPRNVFISDYHTHYAHLLAYSRTDAFQQDMKRRPGVERIIAHLTRYHGVRRARYRGLDKVDYQVKMAAMIYNVRRWLRLQPKKPPAPSQGEDRLVGAN